MKHKHKVAYMKTAEAFAECSVGTRLKVGAVIVKDNRIISCGYNAHPEHIDGALEGADGQTLSTVRHAEKSALMGLLRAGISPVESEMFCNYSCCASCAVDIVDAGIIKFTYKNKYRDSAGIDYLVKNNVEVIKWEDQN